MTTPAISLPATGHAQKSGPTDFARALLNILDDFASEQNQLRAMQNAVLNVLEDSASVASHDLQEPLRKVQAFGDRLLTEYGAAMGEQGQDYLDRMLKATKRMQSLIRDLLTFSRIGSKGRSFLPVDLAQVTLEVL